MSRLWAGRRTGGGTARIRVRVRVGKTEEGAEPAKKKSRIGLEEALSLLGTNLSFLRWEALADKDTMKYGSRCYIKGVPKSEEKLFGHMVRTLEGNAKRRPQMGQGVAAATKEGGKRGQRLVVVLSPVVVAKGRKG